MTDPVLSVDHIPDDPRAVALVLHGGRSQSTAATTARQLAVLRMRPFATALTRAGRRHGLVVARLRFQVRGWNGAQRSPVPDAEWALDRLAERFPGLPVGLVGHSMGGRTALFAGGHEAVRSVVGLAPWIEPGDPSRQLAGRRVLLVHGDRDRMTSAPASERLAHQLEGVAASVAFVSVANEGHPMLRRARLWHELAAGFTLGALCAVSPEGTVRGDIANTVQQALDGRSPVVV
ncbi:alpha/beta hydrolase [Jatrophihabitans fulvus]